jgi:hypothetical protein
MSRTRPGASGPGLVLERSWGDPGGHGGAGRPPRPGSAGRPSRFLRPDCGNVDCPAEPQRTVALADAVVQGQVGRKGGVALMDGGGRETGSVTSSGRPSVFAGYRVT